MTEKSIEVLLVEDNPQDITLALRAFKQHNMVNRIQVVRDGQEALDFLFGSGSYTGRPTYEQPKVILLDLKLPRIDGFEVLRQIRTNPLTQKLPVVVLTSSSEERDLAETYKLGINSYIVKPVDFSNFMEIVRNLGLYWVLLNKVPVTTS